MLKKLILPSFLVLFCLSQAQAGLGEGLYSGSTLSPVTLSNLIDEVGPGTVLFLGENHGLASHRDQHLRILNLLRLKNLKVSVGMEFINYTDQFRLDLYREGILSESQFLQDIRWGSLSFDFYRGQVNFPEKARGESAIGLNIPRSITTQISRQGLASLTEEQLRLLPPQFALGRASYRERFMNAAGSHCRSPENCFAAQSVWDDTMAWQAAEFMRNHPDQVLVIIVGEFHVQYGGGTPDRLKARWPEARIMTLSQVWTEGMSPEEIQAELQPSSQEGPRADYIWLSSPEPTVD